MNEEALGERLVRIETKLDVALRSDDDHEHRIRKLERRVMIAAGAIGAASGYVAQLLPTVGG